MVVGFTGTRNGMTDIQKEKVDGILQILLIKYPKLIALHGDCVGADDDFHKICRLLEIPIEIRPCDLVHYRAFCEKASVTYKAEKPMKRNRAIVAQADVMIACPPNFERIKRGSGTWATISFSKKANVLLYIIYPNGSVDIEKGE